MKKFKNMLPFILVILFIITVICTCIYIAIKKSKLDVTSYTLETTHSTIIEYNIPNDSEIESDDDAYDDEVMEDDDNSSYEAIVSESSSSSNSSSSKSSSSSSSSSSTSYPTTKYVNTTSSNPRLKVHSGPSTSYSTVGYVYRCDEVTVYEVKNGFARIGDNLWVSNNYLSDTKGDCSIEVTIDDSSSSSSSSSNSSTGSSDSSSSSSSQSSSGSSTTATFVESKTEVEVTNTTLSYGVIKVITCTTTYDLYSDGSKRNNKITYETTYDYSGYSETTSSLKSDAISNKTTYASSIQDVLDATNALRSDVGVSSLTLDSDLTTAAMLRAIEIAYSGVFDHTRPNNTSWYKVLSELGISYSYPIGENIAMGSSVGSDIVNVQWKNSEGHYQNMINSSFTKIGIGVVKGPNGYYWVQIFGG